MECKFRVNALNHTYFVQLPIWSAYDTQGSLIHIENGETRFELSGAIIVENEEMFVTNGFYAENKAFFNAIRGGSRPQHDVKSAMQIVEISDCIRNRKNEYTSPYANISTYIPCLFRTRTYIHLCVAGYKALQSNLLHRISNCRIRVVVSTKHILS